MVGRAGGASPKWVSSSRVQRLIRSSCAQRALSSGQTCCPGQPTAQPPSRLISEAHRSLGLLFCQRHALLQAAQLLHRAAGGRGAARQLWHGFRPWLRSRICLMAHIESIEKSAMRFAKSAGTGQRSGCSLRMLLRAKTFQRDAPTGVCRNEALTTEPCETVPRVDIRHELALRGCAGDRPLSRDVGNCQRPPEQLARG